MDTDKKILPLSDSVQEALAITKRGVDELIIESDDPGMPVRTIEVLAYTIWEPCGCRSCCDECRKGTCAKTHTEHCCQQGYPCCCDDDEDDDD